MAMGFGSGCWLNFCFGERFIVFLDLSPLGSGSQENVSGEGNIELPELWEEGCSGAPEFRGRKCLHQLWQRVLKMNLYSFSWLTFLPFYLKICLKLPKWFFQKYSKLYPPWNWHSTPPGIRFFLLGGRPIFHSFQGAFAMNFRGFLGRVLVESWLNPTRSAFSMDFACPNFHWKMLNRRIGLIWRSEAWASLQVLHCWA